MKGEERMSFDMDEKEMVNNLIDKYADLQRIKNTGAKRTLLRCGDLAGIRTPDPLLKRQLLCRLSYQVKWQGRRDSNPLYRSQSPVCYRYTTSLWMRHPLFYPAAKYKKWGG